MSDNARRDVPEKPVLQAVRRYEAPALRHLGSVRQLTLGATPPDIDGFGGKAAKNPGHGGSRRT